MKSVCGYNINMDLLTYIHQFERLVLKTIFKGEPQSYCLTGGLGNMRLWADQGPQFKSIASWLTALGFP